MPRGSQPKYLAIFAELRGRILDGRLAPSEQLPSQQELATEFGVTIMTLRQAIAELEAEGLIWVSRGRGSFVVDQPLTYQVGNLTSFAQQVTGQGFELVTKVLGVGEPETEEAAARVALGLATGRLTEIRRLRLVARRPVVLQRTILAAAVADQIDLDLLGDESLYDLLAAATGFRVARARESLRAVVLDGDDAKRLDQPVGAPAMQSRRTSLSADTTPFLYDHALLVGEAASIEADRQSDRLSLRYQVDPDDTID